MAKKYTKEQAQAALDALVAPRNIQILEWGGNTRAVSTFLDKDRDVKFSATLRYIRASVYHRPSIAFRANTEKKEKVERKTLKQQYGVANISQIQEIKDKKKATFLKRYGVSCNLQAPTVKEQIAATNMARYGSSCSLNNEEIRKKRAQTWQKYAGGHPLRDPAVRARIQRSRVAAGLTFQHNGQTYSELAKQLGCSYTFVQQALKAGKPEKLERYKPNVSSYEVLLHQFLLERDIPFVANLKLDGSEYRPDILIEDKKVVIEVDGCFWHSDLFKTQQYHREKLLKYEQLGYRALFFRSNEVDSSEHIVLSTITHRLGMTPIMHYARNLKVSEMPPDFFSANHLMGEGSGRSYGLYTTNDRWVAGIQVRWLSKEKKSLEISRFCTAMYTHVGGGFSKLLKHVIACEQPKEIVTFIDRRYGQGSYLTSLGFTKSREQVSFGWTDGKSVVHRMAYPGNSGYEQGLYKIYDCGQAKYVRAL